MTRAAPDHQQYWPRLAAVSSALALPMPAGPGVDGFMPFLERMREEGAVVVLKLDGERRGPDARPYTCVVSGGPLGHDFFRTDARSAADALAFAVVSYFEAVPHRRP